MIYIQPNVANDDGDTALHITARNNDMKSIKILHKFGGDGNIANNDEETAITIAHELKFDHIVEFLGGLPTSPSLVTPMPEAADILPDMSYASASRTKSRSSKP